MVDRIVPYGDEKLAANDVLYKDDILAAIVQNGMFPSGLIPEDIYSNSHRVSEGEALRLFYHNLYKFLENQGFEVSLTDNENGIMCLTNKGPAKFRIEFEKDAENRFIIQTILKIGPHTIATLREGELIEDTSVTETSEGVSSQVYAVVSTQEDFLARVFFNTTYSGSRKRDILKAFGLKHNGTLDPNAPISIDYNKLSRMIGEGGIQSTQNFIQKYGPVAFMKIMKDLLEE